MSEISRDSGLTNSIILKFISAIKRGRYSHAKRVETFHSAKKFITPLLEIKKEPGESSPAGNNNSNNSVDNRDAASTTQDSNAQIPLDNAGSSSVNGFYQQRQHGQLNAQRRHGQAPAACSGSSTGESSPGFHPDGILKDFTLEPLSDADRADLASNSPEFSPRSRECLQQTRPPPAATPHHYHISEDRKQISQSGARSQLNHSQSNAHSQANNSQSNVRSDGYHGQPSVFSNNQSGIRFQVDLHNKSSVHSQQNGIQSGLAYSQSGVCFQQNYSQLGSNRINTEAPPGGNDKLFFDSDASTPSRDQALDLASNSSSSRRSSTTDSSVSIGGASPVTPNASTRSASSDFKRRYKMTPQQTHLVRLFGDVQTPQQQQQQQQQQQRYSSHTQSSQQQQQQKCYSSHTQSLQQQQQQRQPPPVSGNLSQEPGATGNRLSPWNHKLLPVNLLPEAGNDSGE